MEKLDIEEALEQIGKAELLFNHLREIQPRLSALMKAIPSILPDLICFFENVKVIIPRINKIRDKIEKSIENMPVAKLKIETISKETESTTLGIMDRLDGIMDNNQSILDKILQLKMLNPEREDHNIKEIEGIVSNNEELLGEIYGDLQFQDITAQQLLGVRSILIEISNSLGDIVDRFAFEIDELKGTYDKDATTNKTIKNQSYVDEIIENEL